MGKLGERLWKQIELPQGLGFVSDQVEEWDDEEVARILRIVIPHQRKGLHIMERLLKSYEERKSGSAGEPSPQGGAR
jgi:hypothetical protein